MAPITFSALNGTTVTAQTLADAIAGAGVTVTSATFTGDNSQAGLFNSALGYSPNWLAYDSGVLLSTGNLNQVLGPNTSGGSSVNAPGTGANADLSAIGGATASDAAVLEFTIIPTSNRITLQFTFGSEEYNEYVYSNFNDAMAVWVNGINAAVTPNGQPISIGTINQAGVYNPANGVQTNDPNPQNGVFDSSNASLYNDNTPNSGKYNTGMDGFTVTLTLVVDVNIGVSNTIRIGIADIGDSSYDSFLFVRADSLQVLTIAETDLVSTGVDLPISFNPLANDFDSQGLPLTITQIADKPIVAGGPAISLASGASISLGLDGKLTYTPPAGFLGEDLLTYTITNGAGNIAVGYIDVNVVPNSRPIVDLNGNDVSPSTTIADNFVLGNYSNNSGATNWSAGWIEGNDDSNPGSGSIQIINDGTPALRIGNANRTITRSTNLTAYSHATLSFDFRRVGFDNINDFVAIEVSADGTNFTEIGRFVGPGDDATYSSFSADISSFVSANTTIRFRTSAALASTEFLFVDNVNITAISPQTSFSTSYTENGSGVAIAATTGAGVNVIDHDSPNLSRAIITITNAVAGDQLAINGSLPSGITAVFSDGGTTITLQGTASLSSYKTAIEQIRFSSTSNHPTALTRLISVVVFDETNLASDPAIASITVVPVNDDATAVYDTNSTNQNTPASGNVLGNDLDPENDPLNVSHVNGLVGNLGQPVAGSNGGTFVINSDGSYTFDPGSAFTALAVGQSATTSVTYSMNDGQGGSSTATVTLTINGLNDPTASSPIGNQTNNDGQSINLNVAGFFSDPDTATTLIFSIGGGSLPPGLSLNPATGLISGTIASSASAGGPYSVTIVATDPQAASTSQLFTWTILNPVPVAQDDSFTVNENGTLAGNVLADNGNGTDSDTDDTISVTSVAGNAANVGNATAGSNGGLFTIASNGTFSFQHNGEFDYLALGQSATTTITYTVTDADGATDTATVSVLVTGLNDPPVAVGVIANQSGNDSSSVNFAVSSYFTDPDTTNTLSFSAGTTLPPGLSIHPTTGVISGTLNSSASAGGPYTVVITATDALGASVTQTFTWLVTNPAPVAQDDSFTVNENGTLAGNVLANNGNGIDSDSDDTISVTAVSGNAANVGNATAGSNGGLFTIASNGTLSFQHNGEFDYLALGQSATSTITYTVADADGATDTATVSVLVTGLNDPPVAVGVIANQSGNDSSSVNFAVSSYFTDPDTTNTLSFSAGATLPPGLSIHPTTGVISGVLDSSASAGGPYTVVITATDPHGASVTQTFVWVVNNPMPIAQDDNFTVNENGTLAGNVLANNGNGIDSDSDDTISVTAVGGNAANVGNATAGSNGGLFTIASNGTLSFQHNGDFDYLALGQSATSTITYTLTDADGAMDTATVSVLVTGLNDPPVAVGVIAAQIGTDSSSVNFAVSSFFADPDTTNVLAFSAGTTLPPGLSIHPTTGVISGVLDSSASVGGPYTVTITATDPQGTSVTQSFVWVVTNPAPLAVDETPLTTENATVGGNVLVNDSDPDGDTTTVIDVNGDNGNVGAPIAGTNGGSFVVNSDGTYLFDPGTAFDDLAVGESRSTRVTYTISDGEGATATASVTVTVQGRNDAPASTPLLNQSGYDSDSVLMDVSASFSDPEISDELTFSDGGTLPPGLSIDSLTGIISGTIDSSASLGGPYIVTITATDPLGATTSQTFSWNVQNLAPTPVNDPLAINGNATATNLGNALDNDSDPDRDSLSVVPQSNVPGSNGGIFSIAADGTITFDPNVEFGHVHVTDSLTTTLQYTLIDADGATSMASISVTVVGTNQTPIANPDRFTVDGSSLTGNALDNDLDPNGDSLSGSVTIQPRHGTLVWQADGSFTYTPGPTFVGADQFTYVVRDLHGAQSSAVVHLTGSFAWDSFRNESIPAVWGENFRGIEQLISYQLESLGSQPILAGYATPGAILKGRIYDLSGTLLSEATTQVNAAGNWVMNFYTPINRRNLIVIIDHIATEEVLLGDLHHFRLTNDTYRSLQLGAEHNRLMTPATILADRPSLVLEKMHQQNLNPLALL